MNHWTEEDRANLGVFLNTPTGQRLIGELKEQSRVKGNSLLVPGIDLKEASSQAYAFAQGQSDIIDTIDSMKPPVAVNKPLPPAFQPTPPPKQEPTK